MAINNPVIADANTIQNIAVAIQEKDNGSQMTVDEMPTRIANIPTGAPVVLNPALVLWDWEGTKLAEYSAEDALALTELPAPSTLSAYATADHELLVFQEWNWSLADIKTYVSSHDEPLHVGAIYTTSDNQDHYIFPSPSPAFDKDKEAKIVKTNRQSISVSYFQNCRSLTAINIPSSVTSIGSSAFQNCRSLTAINIPSSVTSIDSSTFQTCSSLTAINIPSSVTSIGSYAFHNCASLTAINIPNSVTSISSYAFQNCMCLCDILLESKPSLSNTSAFPISNGYICFYVPRANLSWFETATNWSTYYSASPCPFLAIEDNIAYLESCGFNVDAYKE